MNEIISGIIGIAGGGGIIMALIKSGLIKIQIGKNGNGVQKQLTEIQDNHLHEVKEKLDKLIEISQKVLYIVEDLKK